MSDCQNTLDKWYRVYKKDFKTKDSKPRSQTGKHVTHKQDKQDAEKIQSKSVNKESKKPKVDKVKNNITDKDIDNIQANDKQKPSKTDAK